MFYGTLAWNEIVATSKNQHSGSPLGFTRDVTNQEPGNPKEKSKGDQLPPTKIPPKVFHLGRGESKDFPPKKFHLDNSTHKGGMQGTSTQETRNLHPGNTEPPPRKQGTSTQKIQRRRFLLRKKEASTFKPVYGKPT